AASQATVRLSAPALASALETITTSVNRSTTLTSCATVTPSRVRAYGPRESNSSIIAIVMAGDAAAASVPSTRATVSLSCHGWCGAIGSHEATDHATRLTATKGK